MELISVRGRRKKPSETASVLVLPELGSSVGLLSTTAGYKFKVKLLSFSHPCSFKPSPPFAPPSLAFPFPLNGPGRSAYAHLDYRELFMMVLNNSCRRLSGACAGVARVIHHDLANLPPKRPGHHGLHGSKCGQHQDPSHRNINISINKI